MNIDTAILSSSELVVLDCLLNNAPAVVSKKEIAKILRPDLEYTDALANLIEVFIVRLRKKIGARYIITVRGQGYKFVQEQIA